jgi:RNA polymerase sigma-70 factor (ECF subfamily)
VTRRLLPLRRVDGSPADLSDQALVAACATGDAAALGGLFDRHHDRVRRYLARLSGTDDRDLDDLVQSTFEALPRAARRFDRRAKVSTWLLGIATNVARHHVRGEVRRRRLAEAAAADARPAAGDAAEDLLTRERAARLRDAVAELPAPLREAFVLVYLEGLPGREVADLLGVREGTIWDRLHQARARLREALEGVKR